MMSDQTLKGKKILMVLDAPFPSDLRLEKEIPTLIKAGAEVTLLCYRREGEAKNEELGGLKIVRTEKAVSNRVKGLVDIYNSIFFSNPLLKKELTRIGDFDVVHVHDLSPAGTVINWARKRKIKTILDLHENYPEALKVWFTWRKNLLIRLKNKAFFSYQKWFDREAEMCKQFDQIIAVIDEMKSRLIEVHQIDPSKIAVVANTESKDAQSEISSNYQESADRNLVYVGGIGPHRGLQTAIEGMSYLKDIQNLKLLIVGGGNKDTIEVLKNLTTTLNLEDRVDFIGRVPFEKALGYMHGAFLNIIPHLKNNHTDNTIPHKLFQIMNSGFPLMVSSCEPMRRIVSNQDCGLIFEAEKPQSFAEQVRYALNNEENLVHYTQKGRNAVQEGRWNWEFDAAVLLNIYMSILE